MLETGDHLLISENDSGRGYAVAHKGSPNIVAATTPEIASELLWACLARADGEVEVRWITTLQNWAIPVVLEAGLALSPPVPSAPEATLAHSLRTYQAAHSSNCDTSAHGVYSTQISHQKEAQVYDHEVIVYTQPN
jgi:hypothetical protein